MVVKANTRASGRSGRSGHDPTRSVDRDASREAAHREVLHLAVRFLGELPLPTILVLLGGAAGVLTVSTSRRHCAAAVSRGEPAFGERELHWMVVAGEHEVAWAGDLATWCDRKRRRPGWCLDARSAGLRDEQIVAAPPRGFWWDGARGGEGGWLDAGWTFERLLAHYELELVDVEIEPLVEDEGA